MSVYQFQASSLSNEQRAFIQDNFNLLPEYTLEDLWRSVVADKFKQETGFYLSSDRGVFEVSTLKFEVSQSSVKSYEDLIEAFNMFQQGSGMSSQDAKEQYRYGYLWRQDYIRIEKKGLLKAGGHGLRSIIDLLVYVVTGRMTENLKEANDVMDLNGWSYASYFRNEELQGLGSGLVLTRMKNGKVAIKGLSSSQWAEIERLFALFAQK